MFAVARHCLILLMVLASPATALGQDRDPNQTLQLQIASDDTEFLRRRLSEGLSINHEVREGCTLLQSAVLVEADACARLLVDRGAEIDILSAAALGDVRRVKEILADDPREANRVVRTRQPLHLAAREGHVEIIRLLTECGADLKRNTAWGMPIHIAAQKGRLDAVRLLVKLGSSLEWKDTHGYTVLFHANSAEMVKLLLDLGANPVVTANGISPLDQAAGAGDLVRIKLLLDQKLPQSIVDAALHACARAEDRHGSEDAARFLLDSGARLTTYGPKKQTVLHTAVLYGSIRMCEFFLDRGVPIDARDSEGETALHYAAWGDRPEIYRLLIRRGADPEIRDDAGLTAADYLGP